MSDQYIEIAPNYASTSRLAQTISSAMGEAKKFTLHNAQFVEKVPELMLILLLVMSRFCLIHQS